MRTTILNTVALGTLSVAFPAMSQSAGDYTNFIVIYLDDMGYGDLGVTGATGYQTPQLDRMAKEGIFFTPYYSPQAVSSSSRAGLMTGCYPSRIGLSGALDHTSTAGPSKKEETNAG